MSTGEIVLASVRPLHAQLCSACEDGVSDTGPGEADARGLSRLCGPVAHPVFPFRTRGARLRKNRPTSRGCSPQGGSGVCKATATHRTGGTLVPLSKAFSATALRHTEKAPDLTGAGCRTAGVQQPPGATPRVGPDAPAWPRDPPAPGPCPTTLTTRPQGCERSSPVGVEGTP